MKISVLGLGHMGTAIATHLIDVGHKVTVWNRTPSRATPFADRALLAANPAEALASADLVVVSTLDNKAARDILVSAGYAIRGSLVVNLSSDTPASSRALSQWAHERGVRYLAGVMVTPSTIVGQSGSTMLVAGDEADLDSALPVLTTIAPTVTVLGNRHELPASFDTALLGVFWTTLAAWAHGTALARAHGIDGKSIAAQLTAMVQLAADIGPGFARDADNRTYPADTSTIMSAVTTMQHVTTASKDAGVDSSLPAAVTALYEHAASGHDTDSPSRVTEAM
ncbi:MAG: NAD(P)-binding domain-containing protein [Rhodococcus sp. (in: high G+C Gram-positive bacteria)]|uniref:NAD(P)-dependent oxidoreductase n=1 Tax=Rhodococcus sp. TaxID=1831 RepID=UPI002ADA968A|nr:NAD(P)-binding domain-containing protein [Rhodococcus sp. (in: high G+C Gram-positive bacteria)]